MATVQPSWNAGWIWGERPQWPKAQAGSWSICQPVPANFNVRGEGKGASALFKTE